MEVFYTGGGIWLVEYYFDEITYGVISSEAPEYLTIYESGEDEDKYLPENMIASKHKDELNGFRLELYNKMLDELKKVL